MDKTGELRKKSGDLFWDVDPLLARCTVVEAIDILRRINDYLNHSSEGQFAPVLVERSASLTHAEYDILVRPRGIPFRAGSIAVSRHADGCIFRFDPISERMSDEAAGYYRGVHRILLNALSYDNLLQPKPPALSGAGTSQPITTGAGTVRVPKRPEDKRKWKTIWRWTRGQVEVGTSTSEVHEWLKRMHPKQAVSRDTLTDIIRAGESNKLD